MINILEQDVICHLITELLILQASKLDKRTNIIPILLIRLFVCLAHSAQLICNLLGNIIRDLINKSIILQSTSGYVQWQIRAVNHSL